MLHLAALAVLVLAAPPLAAPRLVPPHARAILLAQPRYQSARLTARRSAPLPSHPRLPRLMIAFPAPRTATARAPQPAVARRQGVEVLHRPKPVYTPQARDQGIEGSVLLEIVYQASGEVHVLRILHGLGFGLDEAAVQAARGIRFKPAAEDSRAVDERAILNVVFQLAG